MTDTFDTPNLNLKAMQDDIGRATAGMQTFGKETRTVIQSGRQFGTAFGTALEGLILKGQSLNDTIRNLGLNLSRVAFRAAFRPLEKGIGDFVNSMVTSAAKAGTNTGAPTDVASWAAGTSVTFNVNATDVESFSRSEAQIASLLARAVTTGQRNL